MHILLICLLSRTAGSHRNSIIRKYPHQDDVTTKELIFEGWNQVSQKYINEKVIQMPDRPRAVMADEGKTTDY